MSGFLLAIHLDRTIRTIPAERQTAEELDDKFGRLAVGYLNERELVPYEAGYSPTPDEVLVTEYDLGEPLSKIKKGLPAGLKAMDSKTLAEDPPVAIVHVKPGSSPTFSFQVITKGNLLAPRSALLFGNKLFEFNEQVGLMPRDKLDALYEGGQLYFRNELQVRRFLDMEKFFTEASDELIEDYFGGNQFVVDDAGKLKSAATNLMRRKIARLAAEKVTFDMRAVKRVAGEAGLSVKFRGTSLVVPPDRRGLRDVVDLLSDSYVRGTVRANQLYFASSKRRVSSSQN